MKKILLIGLMLSSLASAADEFFYANLGFGKASISYPSGGLTLADTTRTTFALDFGLYIPYENFLFGLSANGVSDYYSSNSTSSYLQYNLVMRSLSAMYFLNNDVEGFFARADVGSAEISASANFGSTVSDTGLGVLLGVGYKWWSLYAAINVSNYMVNSETTTTTMFNVGFLW